MTPRERIHLAIMLVALIAIATAGCKKAANGQGGSILNEDERQSVENAIHLLLPPDTVLLVSDDGGGRDPKYQFHLWLLYSPSKGIRLDPDAVPSPSGDLPNRNPSDIAEWIQSLLKDRKLPYSVSAASLRWEANGFEFRGDLLRTTEGDYLSIQRFAKSAITGSAGP